MKNRLVEGIADTFKDMPSLGQFKDDAYRYLVKSKSKLIDRIDKSEFDTERINDVENPRYFTGGPNKNRFQLPDRIDTGKTQLYFRFSIIPAANNMQLEIGMNLKSFRNSVELKNFKIKPYTNTKIKITDFINSWTNYNWSNEMKLAVAHFKNQTGIEKASDTNMSYSLEDFLKSKKLNKEKFLDAISKKIEEVHHEDIGTQGNDIFNELSKLFKDEKLVLGSKKLDLSIYIENGDALLSNENFLDKVSEIAYTVWKNGV